MKSGHPTSRKRLTIALAKKAYIAACGNGGLSACLWYWKEVRDDLQGVVDAKSDRAAGRTIDWWGCWDRKLTATAFARRVREFVAAERAKKS